MNLDELKPGPETDVLVANSIGCEGTGGYAFAARNDSGQIKHVIIGFMDGINFSHFRPSEDLNDAFWAAEKIELFEDLYLYYESVDKTWRIVEYDIWNENHEFVVSADTVAFAICKAILWLRS